MRYEFCRLVHGEEVVMKVKSQRHESASPQASVGRRRVPRVAVARRFDSERPTRVWSLLLPPSFSGRKSRPTSAERPTTTR